MTVRGAVPAARMHPNSLVLLMARTRSKKSEHSTGRVSDVGVPCASSLLRTLLH